MHTPPTPVPPDAVLLIGSGCPHCHAVLNALARLVQQGMLGRLEVVNVSVLPDVARAHDARSVPWTRLGPFELLGALPASELAEWAELAASGQGWTRYFGHLIETNRLDAVSGHLRAAPGTLVDLLDLLASEDTPMSLRIGISAVIEGLAGSPILRQARPAIELLTLSPSAQIRADACHFLGLAGDAAALPVVRRLLDDDHPDVREIAADVQAMLRDPREPSAA